MEHNDKYEFGLCVRTFSCRQLGQQQVAVRGKWDAGMTPNLKPVLAAGKWNPFCAETPSMSSLRFHDSHGISHPVADRNGTLDNAAGRGGPPGGWGSF